MKENPAERILNDLLADDAFIKVNVKLLTHVGIPAAILLASLTSIHKHFRKEGLLSEDGFFYRTQETLQKTTTLSPYQQSEAIKDLQELNFIEVVKRGNPPKRYFKVNHQAILFFFEKGASDPNFQMSKNSTFKRQKTSTYNNKIINNKIDLLTEDKSSIRSTEPGGSGRGGKLHRRKKSQILKASKEGLRPKGKKPKPEPKVRAKVRSVLRYWEGKGLHLSREGTKSYRDGIVRVGALFDGTAFAHTEYEEYKKHRFGIAEIRKAIDRFALAALDPHYLPVSQYKRRLRGVSIGAFVYSPFAQNGSGRSLFIHYLENPPVVSGIPVEPLEDQYPKLTSALRRGYRREVLGGAEEKLSVRDENHFILASQRLMEFMKRNRNRLKWYQEITPALLAGWVLSSLKMATGGDTTKITPGWFSSEMMFNRRLPTYMHAQALFGEEEYSGEGTRVGLLH